MKCLILIIAQCNEKIFIPLDFSHNRTFPLNKGGYDFINLSCQQSGVLFAELTNCTQVVGYELYKLYKPFIFNSLIND